MPHFAYLRATFRWLNSKECHFTELAASQSPGLPNGMPASRLQLCKYDIVFSNLFRGPVADHYASLITGGLR